MPACCPSVVFLKLDAAWPAGWGVSFLSQPGPRCSESEWFCNPIAHLADAAGGRGWPGAGLAVIRSLTESLFAGRGILPLHVPQDAAGLCSLLTVVECDEAVAEASAGPCPLTATADLRLLPPVRDVIVRPDRAHAAPGDTVGFWILALSHDMTLPADVQASVSVKDPAGTKVAVWEDVPLDQGKWLYLPTELRSVHERRLRRRRLSTRRRAQLLVHAVPRCGAGPLAP